jgi:predicted peptidase
VNYRLQISEEIENQSWIEEKNRILPLVEKFKLDQSYNFSQDLKLNYAYYAPSESAAKTPLIIWLHGGGEGGRDTSIPLLANRAANYASKEIQHYFGSAYVLVPQCPGAWMHNEDGEVTWGRDNDAYNEALMGLITKFVKENPNVDSNRIYVGGCSNGGYMSLKLILLHPDFFAAGFISALAYRSEYLSEQELNRIKHVPIWFIHAKDDRTTPPEETVVPVYNRLVDLGADKLQFSFFDHVDDISGEFGGADYLYSGHWSWIYSHANKARINSDGRAVESLPGQPSLMEWLADQSREKR